MPAAHPFEGLVEDHAYRHGDRFDLPLLMFSAGGNDEAKANRPSAGRNNTTLALLLNILHREAGDVFRSERPDDYPMLNASPDVESKSVTERTEAKPAEVRPPANVARILRYVAGRDVVAFGKNARIACKAAGIDWIASARHLSFSGLNRTIKAPGLAGRAATAFRVRVVADELLETLRRPASGP